MSTYLQSTYQCDNPQFINFSDSDYIHSLSQLSWGEGGVQSRRVTSLVQCAGLLKGGGNTQT